ncbi:MAG: histidine kinase, partial [Gemmatimonadota bacterium]
MMPQMRPEGTGEGSSAMLALSRRELLLIFAFWTAYAILTVATWFLSPAGNAPPFRAEFVAVAFFDAYLWAVLTPLLFWLTARFAETSLRAGWKVLLLFVIGLVLVLAVSTVIEQVHRWLLPRPGRPGGQRFSSIRYLSNLTTYFAVLAAGTARAYFERYQARRAEATKLEADSAQLQTQLAEARLETLRSQLNPHFLFNTLNAVAALVERDPKGVRRMIARLSELLRSTLEGSAEPEIPLSRELDLLRVYLEIMTIRFQGLLETTVDAAPEILDALVPNLILQPLVENAMKHGVSRAEAGGRIEVVARRVGDELVVTVRDSGPTGENADGAALVQEGIGLGLSNTRQRLQRLYGTHQRFSLAPAENGGMIAEVVVPYHERADLHAAAVVASA